MLRTSLLDPYHALHMTDLYLSGKDSIKFSAIARPRPVQLNRLPTDFSDKDSVEDIPDYNFLLVLSLTVHEISILGFSLRL